MSTAKETFGTRYKVVRKKKKNVCISSKPWFSTDCKIARKQYRKLKRRCKIDPSIETKEDMKRAEKEYKKKMDANIKMHRKEMSRKLKNLRSNNSKEYWNILRQGTNKKQPNISIDSLFEFFRNINKAPETNNEDEINLPDIDSNLINNLNNEINGEITSEEIVSCVKHL